jgi:hypothetical protein
MTQSVEEKESVIDEDGFEILGESPQEPVTEEKESTDPQPEEAKPEVQASTEEEAEPVVEDDNKNETETKEGDTEQELKEKDFSGEQKGHSKRTQRRIDKITKQRENWRTKAEEYRDMYTELANQQIPEQNKQETPQQIEERIRQEYADKNNQNTYETDYNRSLQNAQSLIVKLPEADRQLISQMDLDISDKPQASIYLMGSQNADKIALELATNDDFFDH